jgi:hypothetical protein
VLPLNKRCLPCYENSSVVIYHVGGWFSVSDSFHRKLDGLLQEWVLNISFWGLCIWSSIMKFICCLLPSSRIWFFILQYHGAMEDPRPWTHSLGLASLSLSQPGTAMRTWWWHLAMDRLMSGVETWDNGHIVHWSGSASGPRNALKFQVPRQRMK